MRQLVFFEGGRPVANDDLETLQDDFAYFGSALFQNQEPHVITNVVVTNSGGGLYEVSYGIVWIAGGLHRFSGASGVTLPAEIILGDVETLDERAYQTGGTKPTIQERATLLRPATTDAVAKIRVTEDGVLRYNKIREAQFRAVKEVQFLGALKLDDYDGTGRGKYGTEAHGWGLPNGKNGTDLMEGLFPVVRDPAKGAYDTVGKTGGQETVTLEVSQIPAHTHTSDASNPGPATSGNTLGKSSNTTGGTMNFATKPTGGGQPHENRPPFFVLAARQWIGL